MISGHGTKKLLSMGFEILGLGLKSPVTVPSVFSVFFYSVYESKTAPSPSRLTPLMQLEITGALILCAKTDIIFSLLINNWSFLWVDKTIGKECGSNVSSHLWWGVLHDNTNNSCEGDYVLHNLSERKKTGASVVQANSKSKVTFHTICLACEHFISNSKNSTTPYINLFWRLYRVLSAFMHGTQNTEHFISTICKLLFTVPWLVAANLLGNQNLRRNA